MAALADYADLRKSVIEIVGDSTISDVLKRLTLQAENWLNRNLRHRRQITSDTLTFTTGSAALPSDFQEILHVYDGQGCEVYARPISSQKVTGNEHRYYAIDGSNILIYGISGDRDIVYFAKLPTVTDSPTDNNWLLTYYPDLYQYAVAYEAAVYLRNAELADTFSGIRFRALVDCQIDSERQQYSNAVVRVGGPTP